MTGNNVRRQAVAIIAASTVLVGMTIAATAHAAGTGTFTRITTPSSPFYWNQTTSPTFTVSGVASADVTSVDIDCLVPPTDGGTLLVTTLNSAVPVVNGVFSATATSTAPLEACRLRAIPTGEVAGGYLASYAGPIVFPSLVTPEVRGTTTFGLDSIDTEGTGLAGMDDPGRCSTVLAIQSQPDLTPRDSSVVCVWALPATNGQASPTASTVLVDGHNGYLPYVVDQYLNGSLSLGLPDTAITYGTHRASNGDLSTTEVAPISRCSVDDTYPPTTTSCPDLASTGISLVRTTTIFRAGHQIKIRDAYVSTDGAAHTVSLGYLDEVQKPFRGEAGFTYPHHSTTFAATAAGTEITGFGTGSGSVLFRSDIDAAADDPDASTYALTWSRPPTLIQFLPTSAAPRVSFQAEYSLAVPAQGVAYIGFALSQSLATSDAKTLAAAAVADMISAPTITAPKSRAKLKRQTVTVTGALALGANGLPTAVTVNGHKATIKPKSVQAATYSVKLKLAKGKRTITVVSKDAGGNTASKKETVTVK